ncbi:lysosomal-associated transmembrane protein 4B-like isoform X1 [Homarus americanus]|uniref:lysosomal-associated transmembrane protein 4B-like isoform X1 n=1 Tax=Homarus americanus TaxID=6706 RepID=UPI001C44F672|nr:lysosomal-associated transmembrane protein 4B-like isoform X1 [Homarus americanus]
MFAASYRRALRRARIRRILMNQEGVEVRDIRPPDYTEQPTPPPTYSEVALGSDTVVVSGISGTQTGRTESSREGVSIGCEAQEGGGGGEAPAVAAAEGSTMLGRGRLQEAQGRLEAMRKRHNQWTCFLCCHVRTGTIVIGFWHMLLHLMALSLIAVVVVHPEMLSQTGGTLGGLGSGDELSVNPQDVQAENCAEMPCSLAARGDGSSNQAASDFSLFLGNLLTTHRLTTDDVNIALFITLCTFVVTLLLVYGAFHSQPSHLMPFFFLQVFDFCISSMTMIGYLSYLPNIRQLIRESPEFPFQEQLLAMNTKCLTFFAMLIFITTLMTKAYCISIVWRCYKFLMLRAQAGRSVLRYLDGVSGPVDQESQTLVMGQDLPDYDNAMADPQYSYRKKLPGIFPEPPPSYDMAMAALFARQEQGQDHVDTAGGACEGSTVSSPSHDQAVVTTAQEHPVPITSSTSAATSVPTIPHTAIFPTTTNAASLTIGSPTFN